MFQDVSLVITSGSTSCTSFVRQPALDFKGMITLSQVCRPRGANLIAQEGGVSALLYKDRYRVCLHVGFYSGWTAPQSVHELHRTIGRYVLHSVSTIFCFYFLLYLWKNEWNRMPLHTWNIGKCLGLISCISFSVSADNGLTWLIKIHDEVQTLSRAHRSLKTTFMGNRNVHHSDHNISPEDLILNHFHSHENVNNSWLVISENNFNIILLGTPQSPKQSSDRSLLSQF